MIQIDLTELRYRRIIDQIFIGRLKSLFRKVHTVTSCSNWNWKILRCFFVIILCVSFLCIPSNKHWFMSVQQKLFSSKFCAGISYRYNSVGHWFVKIGFRSFLSQVGILYLIFEYLLFFRDGSSESWDGGGGVGGGTCFLASQYYCDHGVFKFFI